MDGAEHKRETWHLMDGAEHSKETWYLMDGAKQSWRLGTYQTVLSKVVDLVPNGWCQAQGDLEPNGWC